MMDTENKTLVSVASLLDIRDNPERKQAWIKWRGDMIKVEHIVDYIDEDLHVLGMEYGPMLLASGNYTEAWEKFLDWLKPVPMDEVHEAYNAFDKMVEWMESRGHENDIRLRRFCSEWCKTFFEIETAKDGAWDKWELDEAYEHQPNSTDSGIVYVGHYSWSNEIDAADVFFEIEDKE